LVTQEASTIEIEAEALSIPEELILSIEGAEPGTQFTAGQITLPPRVSLVSDPEQLVVNVVIAPTAEELEGEGAGEVVEPVAEAEEVAEAEAPESESE
jgi:large subunit ribosomal protein L25